MASLVDSLTRSIFNKATVIYKQQVAPHVYHLRIRSEALKGRHLVAGEHLRLFVGIGRDTTLDSKVRTYSIWDHDSTQGVADLAVCTHSSGIGSRWITEVAAGEDIYYMGPKGKLVIDTNAGSHLLISDPSALSHMYAIRRAIPPDAQVAGITYSSDVSDHYADVDGSRPFDFMLLQYDPTESLIEKSNSLRHLLSQKTTVYIAGDARVCKSLSRYFRQNWPAEEVRSKGFWMPGKTGMD
ncbi:MAG: side tail fiber protein [Bacteroidetes bacterium]|nr:side tail fiber protein [Bacteroidota bacterium]